MGAHSASRLPFRLSYARLLGGLLALVLLVAGVAAVGPAEAFWRSTGSGSGSATTGTLNPPTAVTVPSSVGAVGSATVPVSWTAPTGITTAAGYYVTRTTGGTTVAACGSSATTLLTTTSCTDSVSTTASFTYTVIAVRATWTARATSGTVSVLIASKLSLSTVSNQVAGTTFSPGPSVTLQASNGATVAVAGVPVTLAIGSNPAAGTLSGTVTVNTDSTGTASFANVSIDKAGTGYTLVATNPGLASATSNAFAVTAASGTKLVFTSASRSATASATTNGTLITVQRQDASGNPAPVAAATTLTLTSTSTGTTLFAPTSGSNVSVAVTIASGASAVSFYYGDTRVGTPTITAAAAGLTPATQTETVTAGAATKLVFTSAATSATASSSTNGSALSVQQQDALGNPVAFAAATTLGLTSSSAGPVVFAPTVGVATTAPVIFAAGSDTATFYYGDPRVGTPTITASAGAITSATQVETILAAPATKLVFTSTAITAAVSASTNSPLITVQRQDAFGNPVPVAATTPITLTSTSPGAIFAPAAGATTSATVSIAAGFSSTTFSYGDTRAGAPSIMAALTGLTSASQTETITTGTATKLVFTSAGSTAPAATTANSSAITVQQQDAFGNPVLAGSSVPLTLTSNSPGTTLFATTSGATSPSSVAIAIGSSSATFYYGDNRAGSPTITAAATGLNSAMQTEVISAGAATKLVFTSVPFSTPAFATVASLTTGSPAITVQRQDALGNPVAVAATTALALTSSSSGTAIFSPTNGSTGSAVTFAAGADTATFYYGDTSAGTPTITASSTGLSVTQKETITAAATKLVFTSSASTVTAATTTNGTLITVQRQDASGIPVPAAVVTGLTLTSTSATGIFAPTSGAVSTPVFFAQGSSTATFFYGDRLAGSPVITAALNGLGMVSQTEKVNAGAASKLVITSAPFSVTASATTNSGTIAVQRQDEFGNPASPAAPATVALSSTSGMSIFATTNNSSTRTTSVTIAASQSSTTFFYGDKTAGTPVITAGTIGLVSAAQPETITPSAFNQLLFIQQPTTSVSGVAFSPVVTVLTADQFGNGVGGIAVNMVIPLGSSLGTLNSAGPVTSDAGGVATFTGMSITSSGGTNFKLTAYIGLLGLTQVTSSVFSITAR